jgi:hypothetical protein
VDKQIAVWQPAGEIEALTEMPAPQNMKSKAESFLETAVDNSHFAAAPEWAYNIEWVTEHDDLLFDSGSPLFVLGCSPVRIEEMIKIRVRLDEEDGYDVFGESVPDNDNKDFVTPTIIPIKSTARTRADKNAILIQYKNQPMGPGANPNERANLAVGNEIWQLDPPNSPSLLVWTCSDVMDHELRSEVERIARQGNYVVHVQCNPAPFNQIWTQFRSGIFNGGDDVMYIAANWGSVTADIDLSDAVWGYSGVYAKTTKSSHLDNYDDTYINNGLEGTKPNHYCEYVWTLTDDGISFISATRKNPTTGRSGQSVYANPHIHLTLTWDDGTYSGDSERVTECDAYDCNEWKDMLPDSPRTAELISSIALGEVAVDELPSVESNWEVCWSALTNLHAGEFEEVSHVFASHKNRSAAKPGPEEVAMKLRQMFDFAEAEKSIRPAEQCLPKNVPVNAKDEDKDGNSVPICLSLVEHATRRREQKRAKWIVEWFRRRGTDFKPIVVTTSLTDEASLKTLDRAEDITKAVNDPEKVASPSGLVKVDR